jgi:peptidoglycan hydrolase CwlO-like protein
MAKKLNDTAFDRLNEAEKKYRQLAKDFRNVIWDQARAKIMTGNELVGIIETRLDRLMNTIGQIQTIKDQLTGELDKSKSNVENLKALVTGINDNYQVISIFKNNYVLLSHKPYFKL